MWQPRLKSFFLILFIYTGLFGQPVWAADTADAGKQLYYKGKRLNDVEITAYVGRASIAMSAGSLPCAGCHGRDGKGKPEGGVKPSDITWAQLSKPYGGTSKNGRKFGTYDEDAFLRAVTEGVDPAGNQLDASMPRYNISRHDARNLIRYLNDIENDYDPGIKENEIIFATLQPGDGWQTQLGDLITSTVQAYFADINQQGGVYGRKLKLKTYTYTDAKDLASQTSKIIDSDETFAFLASLTGNYDQTLTDLAETAEIPSVAPYTNTLTAKGNQHRYTFYVYGGLETQVNALVKRTLDNADKDRQLLILYRDKGPYSKSAEQAAAAIEKDGKATAMLVPYNLTEHAWREQLHTQQAAHSRILFLGSTRELVQIMTNGTNGITAEVIYMPGLFVSSEILKLPNHIANKLELSYHAILDADGELEDFYHFLHKHKFGAAGMSIRLFAYSGARIMIEGLNRAGKRVSREKVITALESLYDFDAGLNQPVRFGSSRRVSLLGAYIVKLDTTKNSLKPTGDWVSLD
jgi:ABC-type branched-subunit amino acid transport system substrate-binding protein